MELLKRTEGERQAYLEGFEAGKRTGICIGQRTGWWISCKEKLPESDGLYLVWLGDVNTCAVLPFDETGQAFVVWKEFYGAGGFIGEDFIACSDVVAWMPIVPYKGE